MRFLVQVIFICLILSSNIYANSVPSVTSTPEANATQDTLYSYDLTATDSDGDTLIWSVKSGTALPSWLELNTTEVPATVTELVGSSELSYPFGVAVDSDGNVYIADTVHNVIKKRDTAGVVTTLVTGLNQPSDVAVDSQGNLYIADTINNAIKKRDTAGNVTPLVDNNLSSPFGVAVDSSGNIYIADTDNNAIKKRDTNGVVTTLISSGLSAPRSVAVDSVGNLYISDTGNKAIKKRDTNGVVTEVISGLNNPFGIAVDSADNLYISDEYNDTIQKRDTAGDITTLVNTGLASPSGVAVDNNGNVYIADTSNNAIKKYTPALTSKISGTPTNANVGVHDVNLTLSDGNGGVVEQNFQITVANVNDVPIISSTAITTATQGTLYKYNLTAIDPDGDDTNWSVISKPDWLTLGSDAKFELKFGSYGSGNGEFNLPQGVAVDSSGDIYVTDTSNHRIQKFDSSGVYLSQIGTGSIGSGNGEFHNPQGVAVDSSGDIYVADSDNHRIQKFDSSGVYLSQIGTGSKGSGNGEFNVPFGIAVDSSGDIYVSDFNNHRIQKFDSSGVYLSQIGTGSKGSGNGEFNFPTGVAVDSSGDIYVSELFNHRIQKFDSSGVYLLQIGTGSIGSGNGEFHAPFGVAVDSSGDIYVPDSFNNRIQKFDSSGIYISQIGTVSGGLGNGEFNRPSVVAVDSSGDIYVADTSNHRIQVFSLGLMLSGTPTAADVGVHDINLTVSDGNGGVVEQNFKITVSSVVSTADRLNVTISNGTVDSSTKITYTPANTNSLKYMFSNSSVSTPAQGDSAPLEAINYTSGTDIANAESGKYLVVYETNSDGEIVGFYQKMLESSDILTVITPVKLTATIPDQVVDLNNTASFDLNLTNYFSDAKLFSFEEVHGDNNITDWLSLDSANGIFSINTNASSLLGTYYIKALASGEGGTNATGYFKLKVKDPNASLFDNITKQAGMTTTNTNGTKDGKKYSESNATTNGQNVSVRSYEDGSSSATTEDRSELTSVLDSKVAVSNNGDTYLTAETIDNEGKKVTLGLNGKAQGEVTAESSVTQEDGNTTISQSELPDTVGSIDENKTATLSAKNGENELSVTTDDGGKQRMSYCKGCDVGTISTSGLFYGSSFNPLAVMTASGISSGTNESNSDATESKIIINFTGATTTLSNRGIETEVSNDGTTYQASIDNEGKIVPKKDGKEIIDTANGDKLSGGTTVTYKEDGTTEINTTIASDGKLIINSQGEL
jgi:streptogramin lyase